MSSALIKCEVTVNSSEQTSIPYSFPESSCAVCSDALRNKQGTQYPQFAVFFRFHSCRRVPWEQETVFEARALRKLKLRHSITHCPLVFSSIGFTISFFRPRSRTTDRNVFR